MRLAILADVHGNLPAFEAALADVARQSVDGIVLLGDIVNGAPDSRLCWELAESLHCPLLRGNHERYVGGYGQPDAPPEWRTDRFAPVAWAAAQFTDPERATMRRIPTALRLPEAPEVLFAHASVRSDTDSVFAWTPDNAIRPMFPDTDTPGWIVRGHNHVATVRLWDERVIVTTGSVGLAFGDQVAAVYLLLDQTKNGWKITHRAVNYDVAATLRRFHDTGYLKAVGPTARLFYREVETAAQHFTPFLRALPEGASDRAALEKAWKNFFQ